MVEILTVIEIAAVILGLLSVYLTTKENIWCWPTGIAMVILYIIVFYNARLCSDMLENFVYIFMQGFGWYYWIYGKKDTGKNNVPVTRMVMKSVFIWASIITIATIVVGYFMSAHTNADFAYLDALTTVMSLAAQWFLSIKLIESWILWITVDVISTNIYAMKGLYFTAGLYGLFLILATMGLVKWYKSMKKHKASS
jgi:nicotinamide mononucleotide transporter